MQDRVGFKESKIRDEFFFAVREASGARTWNELKTLLGLPRSGFQRYQYGQSLLPGHVFDSMMQLLSKENQQFFLEKTFTKTWNWGPIKGGYVTSSKHPEIFEEGKKIANKRRREEVSKKCAVLNLETSLTSKLCEFVGAFIGDGFSSCHKNRQFQVGFSGDRQLDKTYLEERIPLLVNSFYKTRHSLKTRKTNKGYELNFYSKPLYSLLTQRFDFPKGVKTYRVKIPREIMACEEKFVFATVRGIFDTDGCVYIDTRKIYRKPYGRIILKVASKPLHEQLKAFLQIHFSLYCAVKKTVHAPAYEITIYGNKQIEKWMRLIGFSNERHLCKIRKLLKAPGGI